MVQVVTSKSWGSRIINAFWGVLVGLALIVGACILIPWNENNGLRTAQSLEQAKAVLVPVSISPVDPKNNLHVVYFSGDALTKDVLHDSVLGISETAIKLDRKVEMYQWEENKETKTEKSFGGSEQEVTNYTYKQVWSDSLIDSSDFREQTGHQNPSKMKIKSHSQSAQDVTVGDFHLSADLIGQINADKAVSFEKFDATALQNKLGMPVKVVDDEIYVGSDPDMPKIGDYRISVNVVVPPQTVSVIAQQNDKTLQAYMAPSGRSVSLLEMGYHSSDEMILNAESANRIMTWVLRGVSLLMMIIGFALLMKPFSVLADVIPFVGSLVAVGTGFVAFVAGLGLWAIVTAIAWFAVRPLWAIGLIAIVAIIIYFFVARKRSLSAEKGG